jgi:hypothetical protein
MSEIRGVTHFVQFGDWPTDCGCIGRSGIVLVEIRSGELHRTRFVPVNRVVQLMALIGFWRLVFLLDDEPTEGCMS